MAMASSVSSTISTWVVDTCMPGCENGVALKSSFVKYPMKLTGSRRRGKVVKNCSNGGKIMAVRSGEEATTNIRPITKERRIVVTGLGVVSPVGHEVDEFYNNLLEGNSGITELQTFDCSDYRTRIAGQIKSFSTVGWVSPKLTKRVDKYMNYLITAGKKAVADAGMTDNVLAELDKEMCGILIGSAMGGLRILNDGLDALRISYRKMNPFCVPFSTPNMGSATLALDLGWMGPNYSISTACATSNYCIVSAANHIIQGEADVMLCGGSDSVLFPMAMAGYVASGVLSQRNDDPNKASRPWDSGRDGFVMGEGSGVLVLEELKHAKKRGAKIYAEFLGGSFTSDPYHEYERRPDGSGIVHCMETALAQTGVSSEDVNYINAYASSTDFDLIEYDAIIRCFGKNPELKVNSSKSMLGHLLGASGGVEAVATVKGKKTGLVSPNTKIEKSDKGLDMNILVGPQKERLDIKVAMSNSFGVAGHNSSILFGPYK